MTLVRSTCLPFVTLLLGFGLVLLPACSAPKRKIEPVRVELAPDSRAAYESRIASIRRDPMAYLSEVLEHCRALDQYSVNFTRQERRGLSIFKSLHEPEAIACKFRREPFSIYMTWLDPDIKYGESTYVAGQENEMVRFIPRHGLFGLPPTLQKVDLQTPVTWGEARYPMTEFGLERMMERTLDTLREAGEYTVDYEGLTTVAGYEGLVHMFRFVLPADRFVAPIREVYIDADTDLPAATRLLHTSGKLEAAYIWADVNSNVTFTDDDFLLEAERK